jgi:hypothetical protein
MTWRIHLKHNLTFQDDLKNKKNEIQTLEDASTDIMMIEDDEEKVLSKLTLFL